MYEALADIQMLVCGSAYTYSTLSWTLNIESGKFRSHVICVQVKFLITATSTPLALKDGELSSSRLQNTDSQLVMLKQRRGKSNIPNRSHVVGALRLRGRVMLIFLGSIPTYLQT